jgi:MFS family permease
LSSRLSFFDGATGDTGPTVRIGLMTSTFWRRLARRSASDDVAGTVIAIQGLRAFLYGFGAVLLGGTLASEGVSAVAAGGIFTAALLGMAIGSLIVGRFAERIGRRRLYAALFVVLGCAGAVFAITTWLPLLFIAALTGTVSTDANESGPITSLEQAMLSATPAATRARVFGRYNAVAYFAGSIGALAAAGPDALRTVVSAAPASQRWLLAFPVVAATCVFMAWRLPSDAERTRAERGQHGLRRSKTSVRRLSALFALDAFAGGLVVQSFIVFWFERRFGTTVAVMAIVFFASGLLQALSSLIAPLLAKRHGLLYTMVFTHLPSNVLLALIPVMPTLPLAIALLLMRSALSQMDVPTRQAYLAALVDPHERTAAAAYTNSARYAARPVAPIAAGGLLQSAAVAAPFLVAGGLKCLYDLAVLGYFRRVDVDEEPDSVSGNKGALGIATMAVAPSKDAAPLE